MNLQAIFSFELLKGLIQTCYIQQAEEDKIKKNTQIWP